MSWCGGGRDQPDARRGEPGLRDPRVDLVAGQLAALAGLGALRHLDLQVVGVDEVLAGDTEPAAGDLLHGRPPLVVQPLAVLAALAGVGLAAEPVHGDGQRLVRLLRDRAVGHRPGGEPRDDALDRLHLLDRHRCPLAVLETEQPAQGHQPLGLRVDGLGVLLEDVVPSSPGRVLQAEHGLRVEQVQLALATPLVLPADLEGAVAGAAAAPRVGDRVPPGDLLGHHVEPDPAELGGGAGEVALDQLLVESDGLEDLGTVVGRDRRDAHLRHHLEHPLAQRLDEVLDRLLRLHLHQAAGRQVLDRLHREVGVDRRGAVADEQRDVVHLADVAGLDDQADLGAGLLPDQVVVHGSRQQ